MANTKQLPYRFKTIGYLTFVLLILTMIGLKLFLPDIISQNKQQLSKIFKALMILSLLTVILSKEKIEDEFISNCRLRAFAFSFLCSAFTAVFSIFGLSDSLDDSSGFKVICTQLVTYILFFSVIKSTYFNSAKQR
jgi:hypothetical protein